ncbi:MAG: hypothetical protein AAGA48_01110 [Myxococcota bacterium]
MQPWRVIAWWGIFLGLTYGGRSVASPPQAPTVRVGTVGLALPEGWTVEATKATSRQLRHSSGWRGLVFGPVPTQDPHQALASLLPVVAPGVPLTKWKLKEASTARGIPVVLGSGFAEVRGVRSYFVPVAVGGTDHVVVIVGIWPNGTPKEALSTFGGLLGGLQATSVGFDSPGDRSIDGFFVGFGGRVGLTAAATVVAEAGTRSYTFLPDGRYAFSDVAMVNPDAYCTRHPKSCGRYAVRGSTLAMLRSGSTFLQRLGVGSIEELPFQMAADALMIGGLTYQRVSPAEGETFEGHYKSVSAGSTVKADFSVFASTDYVFARSGRFSKGGTSVATAQVPGVLAASSSKRAPRAGRYRVDGYELVLTYDDGAVEREPFFVYKGLLVIDGSPYTMAR